MRTITASLFLTALASCAVHNHTPAARSCGVLNDASQLDRCIGKQVVVRGRVSSAAPAQIAGVLIDAPPELMDQPAHAMGVLQRDGAAYKLEAGGALAKAHATKNPR